jgi:hypothetical protein
MCDSVSDMPGGGGCGGCSGGYGYYDSGDLGTTNSWDNYNGPTYSHDDRNPSGSSNNGNTPPNSSSNCTGLNTNHVTCTISDVYGGTPPQETDEEEKSSVSAHLEGEASTGGPKVEKNADGSFKLSASTPYAEGKASLTGEVHKELGPVNIDGKATLEVEGSTAKAKFEVTDKGFEVDVTKPGVSGKIDTDGGVTCFIETASY